MKYVGGHIQIAGKCKQSICMSGWNRTADVLSGCISTQSIHCLRWTSVCCLSWIRLYVGCLPLICLLCCLSGHIGNLGTSGIHAVLAK